MHDIIIDLRQEKYDARIKKLIETKVPDYYQSTYLPSVYYICGYRPIKILIIITQYIYQNRKKV